MPVLRLQSEVNGDDDPLAKALAPPPDETPEQRDARVKTEKEAQLRSDAIDEEINRQRVAEKKSHSVRVLLLGDRRFCSTHLFSSAYLSQDKVNPVSPGLSRHSNRVCNTVSRQIYNFKE